MTEIPIVIDPSKWDGKFRDDNERRLYGEAIDYGPDEAIGAVLLSRLDEGQRKWAIRWWMDGTIPRIARAALPNMLRLMKHEMKSLPLSSFTEWAAPVERKWLKRFRPLQREYAARLGSTNLGDDVDFGKLLKWWKVALMRFMKKWDLSRMECAHICWRVAHTSSNPNARGSSVFLGLPKQVHRIVEEKPGLKGDRPVETIVTGLKKNIVNGDQLNDWTGPVIIGEYIDRKGGDLVPRLEVRAAGGGAGLTFTGKAFERGGLITDLGAKGSLIGPVAATARQSIKLGRYKARIERVSDGAWKLTLIEPLKKRRGRPAS